MTTTLFVLPETLTLDVVRFLMQIEHIRHIPIVDQNYQFVGLVTHRDLLAHSFSALANINEDVQDHVDHQVPIANIMKTDVVTIDSDLDLCSAISILLENKYGCLPVIVEKKLVGIITEADFLKLTYDLLKKME